MTVEQIIRPTGLIDPEIEVRPASNQVDDLLGWIRERVERKERVLVTTLTKAWPKISPNIMRIWGECALSALGYQDHRENGDYQGPSIGRF